VLGGLGVDDWQLALEVFAGIKEVLPRAGDRQLGQLLAFVRDAIRGASAKTIEVGWMPAWEADCRQSEMRYLQGFLAFASFRGNEVGNEWGNLALTEPLMRPSAAAAERKPHSGHG
jgi:hypothetical protein